VELHIAPWSRVTVAVFTLFFSEAKTPPPVALGKQ
jgi:hypothetical protein